MRQMIRTEADRDPEFADWITQVMGAEKIRQCIHCGLCSGNCPLSMYMDYTPRRLMYAAREGFKDDVLSSFTIWLCTSCYACTVACPHGIKVTDIMYALKRRAIEEGKYPRRFPIPTLAKEFGKMVRDSGRISEGLLVTKLMLKTQALKIFGMRRLGIGLLRTGRFSLKQDRIKGRKELAGILDALESAEEAKA